MPDTMNRNPPLILAVEGDAATIRRQGLSRILDEMEAMLRPLVDGNAMGFRREAIETSEALDGAMVWVDLLSWKAAGVMLVGHGNPEGFQIAQDRFMTWEEVATHLAKLEPCVVMLLTCHGGMGRTAELLFETVPSLRVVLGTPATTTTNENYTAVVEFLVEALGIRVPKELSGYLTVLNGLVTGGVVFRRTREGVQRSSPAEMALQDIAAIFGKLLLFEMGMGR